jgi:hypothetical protein
MGNHDDTKRRTGKDKLKDTFNKYGKNTNRGLRIILEVHEKSRVMPTTTRSVGLSYGFYTAPVSHKSQRRKRGEGH